MIIIGWFLGTIINGNIHLTAGTLVCIAVTNKIKGSGSQFCPSWIWPICMINAYIIIQVPIVWKIWHFALKFLRYPSAGGATRHLDSSMDVCLACAFWKSPGWNPSWTAPPSPRRDTNKTPRRRGKSRLPAAALPGALDDSTQPR